MTYEEILNFNRCISWVHSIRYTMTDRAIYHIYNTTAHRPLRVFEIGCADAKMYAYLHPRYYIQYQAIEYDITFYHQAFNNYYRFANFRIVKGDAADISSYQSLPQQDVVICLETLEHMPKESARRTIENVKLLRPKLFVVSVPIEIGPSVAIKNLFSWIFGYHRHKKYTFAQTLWASIYRLDKLPAHAGCHKGFDWRFVRNELKRNFMHVKAKSIPFRFLPKWLANSIYFECH